MADTGADFAGDWFASQSLDVHYLELVKPSRARLAVAAAPDGVPEALSSIETPLRELYYRDENARLWYAPAVRAGIKTRFEHADERRLAQWWEKALTHAGHRTQELAGNTDLSKRRRHFYALAEAEGGEIIPTLSAIRWQQKGLVYCGPVAEEGR